MRTLWALALLVLSGAAVGAEGRKTAPPPKYKMDVVYLFETMNADSPPESMIVVGKFGFRSVAALKRFLEGLPRGSALEWDPGCLRLGGELLSSVEDLADFREFCKQRGIELVIHLGG